MRLIALLWLAVGCKDGGQGDWQDDPNNVDDDEDGWSENEGDCDDSNSQRRPDAIEICDGVDNDCDGEVDEDLLHDYFADSDGDGHGDPDHAVQACSQPSGYESAGSDCDDSSADAHPGLTETCDGLDNDCNGTVDDGVDEVYFADTDADGFGDPDDEQRACSQPDDFVTDDSDCNDSSAAAYPGGAEICDGLDNDCNGEVDEDTASDARTWSVDDDGDGYGDADEAVVACEQPTGAVDNGSDCDDDDAGVSPDATEVCDGIDNDCDGIADNDDADGADTWYADTDGDGYGDPGSTITACDEPSGYTSDATDHDDTSAASYPGADELCDDLDNDGDGEVDEDAVDAAAWYADADADGFGDPDTAEYSCEAPSGTVDSGDDCDDGDRLVNPGAVEACRDGVDNDCDDEVDEDCTIEHCGIVSSDETWSAEYDHLVTCDLTLRATVTVEDTVQVAFDAGTGITVASTGGLVVDGVGSGVNFTSSSASPEPGDWGGLGLDGGDSSLTGLVLRYATTGLVIDGTASATLRESTITDCSANPVSLAAEGLGALDGSNSLSGNGEDLVLLTSGSIAADTTMAGLDVGYDATDGLGVASGVTLTITDGATVYFGYGTGLVVAGELVVEGSTGVTLTSRYAFDDTPLAGDWDGLTVTGSASLSGLYVSYGGDNGWGGLLVDGGTASLDAVTVQGSADSGLYARDATLVVVDSTFQDNERDGITLSGSSAFDPAERAPFSRNTLSGNGDYPISLPPNAVVGLDDGSSYTGNGTDQVVITGGIVDDDASWIDVGVAYLVDGDVEVAGSTNPLLELGPGVTLLFDRRTALLVGDGDYGRLSASGTVLRPVTFSSSALAPAPGDWEGVTFGSLCDERDSLLEFVLVEYGGGNDQGNVVFDACDGAVYDSQINDSAAWGIYRDNGAYPTVDGVSWSGNALGDLY